MSGMRNYLHFAVAICSWINYDSVKYFLGEKLKTHETVCYVKEIDNNWCETISAGLWII